MSDTLALADAWITFWRHRAETGKFPGSDGSEAVDSVVCADPDAGWAVILAILERVEPKPENPLFQALAAGPLEDLLDHHGPAVAERVETEARRSPMFRLLLGGVWPSTIDRAVWSRLELRRLRRAGGAHARQPNQTLDWLSASSVDVIKVERLASIVIGRHCVVVSRSLARVAGTGIGWTRRTNPDSGEAQMRSASVVLVVAMMITFLAGCSPEAIMYADRPFCDPTLRLTATAGLTPTFSWNDGCRVWALRVERAATSTVAWTVGKDDESLDSPIVYGQLPTEAGQFGSPEALQPGVEYRAVLVQRSNGGRVLAETRFTP